MTEVGGGPLSPEVRRALEPLVTDPASTAVLSDFDGTLATIAPDPTTVRPLPGVAAALTGLARSFGRVAVVSGRPLSFLADRLVDDGGASVTASGVRLVGLYGLEASTPDGGVVTAPGVEAWRPVVAEVADRLERTVPDGVWVEPKGSAVTVHWRRAPDAADRATALASAEGHRTGLAAHPGRMSYELRPPLPVDKGSVVETLTEGFGAACYLGDDLGDLPAFAALSRLADRRGLRAVTVAAVDDESPPEVLAAADVAVEGPAGALAVLRWLADHAG